MADARGKQFLKYALAGSTVKRACRVALVVGPLLTLINHVHLIIALDFNLRFVWQTVLTFCVPYAVSTYSSVMTELAREIGADTVPEGIGESGVPGATQHNLSGRQVERG